MDSLLDTTWDVVICGTGLQQSLLALALSRSNKKVLHVDPNTYYGGPEAALSLQEADAWAARHSSPGTATATATAPTPLISSVIFSSATASRPSPSPPTQQRQKLASSGAYALALAPQLLHCRSALVNQLVSSRVYRHLEFQAVSSFLVLESNAAGGASTSTPQPPQKPCLTRVPATREDVFSATDIPSRSKRQLMKFLKFVFAFDDSSSSSRSDEDEANSRGSSRLWRPHATEPLGFFLQSEFGLDDRLRDYVLALTLSLDGARVTVADGLARLHRHVTSMGVFGPGFAAVYPKWGGCGEIVQVGCRAGAVGGGVYVLGAGIRSAVEMEAVPPPVEAKGEGGESIGQGESSSTFEEGENPENPAAASQAQQQTPLVAIDLTTDVRVTAKMLVCGSDDASVPSLLAAPASPKLAPVMAPDSAAEPTATTETLSAVPDGEQRVSRLVAIVGAPLPQLFEPTVEGAPVAGGAVIAIPAGRSVLADGSPSEHPIFVVAHSSDTGECPPGQCVLYFTTIRTPGSRALLDSALTTLLTALAEEENSHVTSSTSTGTTSPDTAGGSTASSAGIAAALPAIPCLYKLSYDQLRGPRVGAGVSLDQEQPRQPDQHPSSNSSGGLSPPDRTTIFRFQPLPADLTVEDASLDDVRAAWKQAMRGTVAGDYSKGGDGSGHDSGKGGDGESGSNAEHEYMVFEERAGVEDDDDE